VERKRKFIVNYNDEDNEIESLIPSYENYEHEGYGFMGSETCNPLYNDGSLIVVPPPIHPFLRKCHLTRSPLRS
jgi:hypothetical protein